MFQRLQNDPKRIHQKASRFFYQDILQLKPQDAVPDKANILFSIAESGTKYLVKKGVLLKDEKIITKPKSNFPWMTKSW